VLFHPTFFDLRCDHRPPRWGDGFAAVAPGGAEASRGNWLLPSGFWSGIGPWNRNTRSSSRPRPRSLAGWRASWRRDLLLPPGGPEFGALNRGRPLVRAPTSSGEITQPLGSHSTFGLVPTRQGLPRRPQAPLDLRRPATRVHGSGRSTRPCLGLVWLWRRPQLRTAGARVRPATRVSSSGLEQGRFVLRAAPPCAARLSWPAALPAPPNGRPPPSHARCARASRHLAVASPRLVVPLRRSRSCRHDKLVLDGGAWDKSFWKDEIGWHETRRADRERPGDSPARRPERARPGADRGRQTTAWPERSRCSAARAGRACREPLSGHLTFPVTGTLRGMPEARGPCWSVSIAPDARRHCAQADQNWPSSTTTWHVDNEERGPAPIVWCRLACALWARIWQSEWFATPRGSSAAKWHSPRVPLGRHWASASSAVPGPPASRAIPRY